MIKVFTSNDDADIAGDNLTEQFEKWHNDLKYEIEVKKIHSNSNSHGWMLVISYEEKRNNDTWK